MGVSVKDVLKLSGGIATAAISGGTVPAIVAGIAGASKLIGEDEQEPPEERAWRVGRIQKWMGIVADLMQKPMNNEVKAQLVRNKIASDWFEHYGERAKESWVNKMHEDVVIAVKTNMALGIEIPQSGS